METPRPPITLADYRRRKEARVPAPPFGPRAATIRAVLVEARRAPTTEGAPTVAGGGMARRGTPAKWRSQA